MPKFSYEAYQKDGSIVHGALDSESHMALAEKLHKDGLSVISIRLNKLFVREQALSEKKSAKKPSVFAPRL